MGFKFESLPQWAQERINQQEDTIRQLRSRQEPQDPAESNVFLVGRYPLRDVPLGTDTSIAFHTGEGKLEVHHEADHLYLTAIGGSIIVQPSSSNAMRIKVGAMT